MVLKFLKIFLICTVVFGQTALDHDESARLIRGLLKDDLKESALVQIRKFLEEFPESPIASDMRFEEGRILFTLGETESAASSLTEFIERYPASEHIPQATYFLAVVLSIEGKNEKAAPFFEKTTANAALPEELRADAGVRLARIYRLSGRCEKALEVLKTLKRNAGVLFELGQCAYLTKDFDGAKKAFAEFLPLSSDEADFREAKKTLALISFHEKRHKEAKEGFEELFKIAPSEELARLLAWCHYHLGDYARAYDIAKFGEKALALNAKDAAFLAVNRASAQGNLSEMRAVLEKFLSKEPENTEALIMLGRVLSETGDPLGALESFRRASATLEGEKLSELHFEMGKIYYYEIRDYKNALRLFENIAKSAGSSLAAPALLFAARCALGEGDRAYALDLLNNLLNLYPKSPNVKFAYPILADIYVSLGRLEDALQTTDMFLAQFPDAEESSQMLLEKARLEERLLKLSDASVTYRFFLARYSADENVPYAYLSLGRVLIGEEKYGEATEVLKVLKQKYPASPEAREASYEMGRAYLSAGEYEYAEALFLEDSQNNPARGLYNAGRAARLKGDFEKASGYFLSAYNFAPQDLTGCEALREASEIALETKDDKQALELLKKLRAVGALYGRYAQIEMEKLLIAQGKIKEALEEAPAFRLSDPSAAIDADKLLSRANESYKRADMKKAREDYERLILAYPATFAAGEARFMVGEMAFSEGDFKKAEEFFAKALEGAMPEALVGRAHYRLGSIAFKGKRFFDAARHFDIAVKDESLKDLKVILFYLAGACYEQEGKNDEARKRYLDFIPELSDKKQMIDEQIHIALFLQREGFFGESLAICESLLGAVETDDLKAEVQFYIAENAKLLGNLDRALMEYLKITYLHPENAMWAITARFEAGRIYEAQGRWDEAVKLYRRIAETEPGSVQSDTAKKRLEEIESDLKKGVTPTLMSEELD